MSAPATAQTLDKRGDMGLDINLFSFHIKRCYSNCTREFNEVNTGLTYTYQAHNRAQVMAGFLKNSFNENSKFLAINFTARDYRVGRLTFTPAFAIGGVDGYEDTPVQLTYKGIAPVLMPNLTVKHDIYRFNIGILPSADTASFTSRIGIVF